MAGSNGIQLHHLHLLIDGHTRHQTQHESNIKQQQCISQHFKKPYCYIIKDLLLSNFQNKSKKHGLPIKVLTGWYQQQHTSNRRNHSISLRAQPLSLEALRTKGNQQRQSPQKAFWESSSAHPQLWCQILLASLLGTSFIAQLPGSLSVHQHDLSSPELLFHQLGFSHSDYLPKNTSPSK